MRVCYIMIKCLIVNFYRNNFALDADTQQIGIKCKKKTSPVIVINLQTSSFILNDVLGVLIWNVHP